MFQNHILDTIVTAKTIYVPYIFHAQYILFNLNVTIIKAVCFLKLILIQHHGRGSVKISDLQYVRIIISNLFSQLKPDRKPVRLIKDPNQLTSLRPWWNQ